MTAEQSTIERALAMNWLAKYMATMPPVVLPAPAGAWAKHKLTGGGRILALGWSGRAGHSLFW
ncbi:hypothetical protein HT118_29570 [Escherichia coli]|nr:hypothetical protein [Escherichia coli]